MVEVFPEPEATSKFLFLVSSERNNRFREKVLKDFSLINKDLLAMRRAKWRELTILKLVMLYIKFLTLCFLIVETALSCITIEWLHADVSLKINL